MKIIFEILINNFRIHREGILRYNLINKQNYLASRFPITNRDMNQRNFATKSHGNYLLHSFFLRKIQQNEQRRHTMTIFCYACAWKNFTSTRLLIKTKQTNGCCKGYSYMEFNIHKAFSTVMLCSPLFLKFRRHLFDKFYSNNVQL